MSRVVQQGKVVLRIHGNNHGLAVRVYVPIRLRAVVTRCPTGVDRVDSNVQHSAQVRRLLEARERGDRDRIATLQVNE